MDGILDSSDFFLFEQITCHYQSATHYSAPDAQTPHVPLPLAIQVFSDLEF
jgi:hypothetical protein